MPDKAPQQLQATAILQLVSGVLNLTVMAAASFTVLGATFGSVGVFFGTLIAAMGCPLGCFGFLLPFCGVWGLALVPIGLLEIVAGIVGLVNPQHSGAYLKIGALLELVSIMFGGLLSAVAGAVSLVLLRDPEVVAYLEG